MQLALRAQTGTRIRCQRVPHYEMLAMILQAIQAAVAYITINNTHYLINSAVNTMIFPDSSDSSIHRLSLRNDLLSLSHEPESLLFDNDL